MRTPAGWYVAVGDSMSIDLYPRLELQAEGRVDGDGSVAVGAASLFHRNDNALWPDFAGRDLGGHMPGIARLDLCVDGATIGHTLDQQLMRPHPEARRGARVVTVTAGGNDLLAGLFDGAIGMERTVDAAIGRYRRLVARVLDMFPAATVLLTTVYDPTDGSGILPGLTEQFGLLPMELLDRFNDAVRQTASDHDRTALADAHAHFLGHGLSAPPGERWYWEVSPIEPGARGASEIRRVWLEALGIG